MPRESTALVVTDEPPVEAFDFGFDHIQETLREFIYAAPHDAPFNICLSGGWGSGKTTLLRRLADVIAEDSEGTEYVRIWFEPWKLGGEVEVRNVLAHRVLQRIAEDGGFLETAKIDVDNKGLLRMVAERLLQVRVDDASRIYRAETAVRETFAEVEDLFKKIARAYLDGKDDVPRRRIVVFVDDLDRCGPERVAEVLEAVKLFFDLPGMVFVFALDRRQLEHAIQVRHDLPAPEARVYLEKIFQLTVALPPKGSRSLVRFLGRQLEEVGIAPVDDDLALAIVERFGRNLRDVKLFVNALSFQRNLDGAGEAGDEALIKWQYLETTIFRVLPARHADDQVGLVRALELLAHGGFLHDLPERDRYVRALRGGPVNHCALIVLALVRARRPELLPDVRLKPAELAILTALEADGDVSAALRVMRSGGRPMADAHLPAMASLTHAAMPSREPAEGELEEVERVTLEAGGLLRANEWNALGRRLADGGDPSGGYLCHLMAHLMVPRSALYLAHLSRVMRHERRGQGAQALLRHAHGLKRDSVPMHTQAAYLCDRLLGRVKVANHLYRKVLEMGTSVSTVPSYLGMNLAAAGDAEGAFWCTLDAYLRAESSDRERRLLTYAHQAGVIDAPVDSVAELEERIGDLRAALKQARGEGAYPPQRGGGEEAAISTMYNRFPPLEEAAEDLSNPLFARVGGAPRVDAPGSSV